MFVGTDYEGANIERLDATDTTLVAARFVDAAVTDLDRAGQRWRAHNSLTATSTSSVLRR